MFLFVNRPSPGGRGHLEHVAHSVPFVPFYQSTRNSNSGNHMGILGELGTTWNNNNVLHIWEEGTTLKHSPTYKSNVQLEVLPPLNHIFLALAPANLEHGWFKRTFI